MVLVDKRILVGGLATIVVGLTLMAYLGSIAPLGTFEMTEEEAADLIQMQQQNRNYSNMAAMLVGIGFLLVLVSFGARRKKGGAKTIEKKPPA